MTYSSMKPVVWFIARFFVVYTVLSFGYSWYISSFGNEACDPITTLVTEQIVGLANVFGHSWEVYVPASEKSLWIMHDGISLVRMFEGCNGITVIILFVSFLFGLSFIKKEMLWFIPLGIFIIYLMNMIRIYGLIYVQLQHPNWTDFVHKYIFTLVIYAMVFGLWVWWVQIWKDRK